MKKVNYIFKINDQEQTNEQLNCTHHDNTITFIYNNEKLIINKENDTLIKSNNEGKITINTNKSHIEIEVPKLGVLNMHIKVINYQKEDNIINLEYIIEDEQPIKNTIIIKLI
jgi:hypothetical protein